MTVGTEELEKLVADAGEECTGRHMHGECHEHYCPSCGAELEIERMASALAAEVLAGRRKLAAVEEALGEAYEWDLHRQSCGMCRNHTESADALCDAGFKLYSETLKLRNAALRKERDE